VQLDGIEEYNVYIDFSYPDYLSDGRDVSAVRFYLPPKAVTHPDAHDVRNRERHSAVHVCIVWAADRDQRALAVLASLYLRNREALELLAGIRHERGRLDFWCRSAEHVREMQLALQDAADAVLWQRGSWKVNPGQVVACKGTIVDADALPADHPLRPSARGQRLGLISATGAA
jgi:hypothetical protein